MLVVVGSSSGSSVNEEGEEESASSFLLEAMVYVQNHYLHSIQMVGSCF